jgi:4-diphosphocytidyl-2-C-methyl-D-erythritol kinase
LIINHRCCKNTFYFRFHQSIEMVVFPNCKINLGLHVLRKRQDGFHDIETCFYPVIWTDILEVVKSVDNEENFIFSSSGITIRSNEAHSETLDPKKNIIYKAYQILEAEYPIPTLKVHLHKILPMGAGLGGGSSDAAFFINLVNTQFQLNMSLNKRKKIAAQLGSDCPFFIENKAMLATGKGEVLEALDLNLMGKTIVVVHPNIHSDTALAYAGIVPNDNKPSLKELLKAPIRDWQQTIQNDFELSVGKKYPEILQLKSELYKMGASYSAMSGSGSAVFGIFENDKVQLPKNWNDYSVYKGILT